MVKVIAPQNFEEEVILSRIPTVVYFWANWCVPCKSLFPVIEELSFEYSGRAKFVKLNVEESPRLASRYMVMSVPTLIVFKGGSPQNKKSGCSSKENILDFILPYI